MAMMAVSESEPTHSEAVLFAEGSAPNYQYIGSPFCTIILSGVVSAPGRLERNTGRAALSCQRRGNTGSAPRAFV